MVFEYYIIEVTPLSRIHFLSLPVPSAHSYQYVRQSRLLNRCKNNVEPFWGAVCIPIASVVFLITSLRQYFKFDVSLL